MKRESRHPIWSWVIHTPWVMALLAILAVMVFFGSGAGNPILSRLIVKRMEAATGAQVELKSLSIRWLSLQATLKGVVLHGHEPAGTPPLFSAEEIKAGLRIDSFWGRKVSLDELFVEGPQIHIRVEKNGTTNVPTPPRAHTTNREEGEKLFDLHVRSVHLENGWILYNDVKTPLAVEGGELRFGLDAGGTLNNPLYLGTLDWKSIQFVAQQNVPLPLSVAAKFTLWRDGFTVEQGVLSAGRSRVDAQVEMSKFAQPEWTFRYRAWVDLLDFKETLRNPLVPKGKADARGEGSYIGGILKGTGSFSGANIDLPYDEFHASEITSRGSFTMNNRGLEIPDFYVGVLGGTVKGKVTLNFSNVGFRAVTHVQDVRLSALFPHIEHTGFPIDELDWDALLTADTVETWTGAFEHFEISAEMQWNEAEQAAKGHEPVSGDWEFRYRFDPGTFRITAGEFTTPTSHGTITGLLDPRNSNLDMKFEIAALDKYGDFIHAIEGAKPGSEEAKKTLSGNVRWDGKMTGPSSGSTFQGHVKGEQVRYDNFALDSLEGELTYSPKELVLERGRAKRGQMETSVDLALDMTEWSFLAGNNWTAEINLDKAPLDSLQDLAGTKYPVHGLLSGQFHGRGTREAPGITGLFDLAEAEGYGFSFNRLRGQLNVMPDEARISNAELRFFPPGKEIGRGAGIVTGSVGYRFAEKTISAELVGAALPLENVEKIQSERFPIGGQVSFRVKASGPAKAPLGEGTIRIVDLRVGPEVIGSFDGTLTSDGQTARLQLGSAMSIGELKGEYTLGLVDPYPLSGKATIRDITLDPFLMTALHLKKVDVHGKADGEIAVSGSLTHPESITVDAQFSKLTLNYASVQLENSGPVHFRSSKERLEIDPVTFKGADTNLELGGSVQFTGRRTVSMKLNGGLDLRLVGGMVSGLETRGPAQINALVEGTIDSPRITGRVHIDNASARAADFPTGLSAIKGDLVFDASRLFFDNLTAEAGGGKLNFSGSINYAEQPLRYDVSVRSDRVRIRYPEGMSWLAGGTLRLTGTPDGGVLSGRVTMDRVTLTAGLENAGVLVSGKEGITGPSTSSTFLRNLQFDIEALSTPDARMEWPGAVLQADANLRVRGTWEHPIMLGHIHILSGELSFAGNRYTVARGDLNFANPFRLDPVVNVEATTTIQQYEITLNFNGPASKLALAYRSDPPLPGNDIVTLLALGQTSSEGTARSGGTTQGSTAGATAILSEAVSSQVGGRMERLFGITRFRVDPGLATLGSATSTQNAGARVTVEEQIARNLTITYVSNVGSTQEQVIQVEYHLNRNMSIIALRDYNGTFGVDLKITKRFD
jgi:translocation and assembly module TamB